MAKKFDDFNKVYAAVLENAKRAAVVAAKETAKQISRDMHKEALKALQYYYADYDPDYYERTYNLFDNSLHRIYEDRSNNTTVNIVIGERFSGESMLPYETGGADTDWVVENFIKGIHSNANSKSKKNKQDPSRYANNMMNKFIYEKVENLMDKYMTQAIMREFIKRMK